jgi:hypothetical protein
MDADRKTLKFISIGTRNRLCKFQISIFTRAYPCQSVASKEDTMLYSGIILLTGLCTLGLILWALNNEHGHVEE